MESNTTPPTLSLTPFERAAHSFIADCLVYSKDEDDSVATFMRDFASDWDGKDGMTAEEAHMKLGLVFDFVISWLRDED